MYIYALWCDRYLCFTSEQEKSEQEFLTVVQILKTLPFPASSPGLLSSVLLLQPLTASSNQIWISKLRLQNPLLCQQSQFQKATETSKVQMSWETEIGGWADIKTGTKLPSRKGWGCLKTRSNLFWAKLKTLSRKSPLAWNFTLLHLLPSWYCLYRLAHGCTFLTVGDLFGVAESTAHIIFQDVCKAIVGCLYDRLVYLQRNLQEWSQELENFLANWEFPHVGVWDGFHVYVSTKLKNCYSYRKNIHFLR